MNPSDRTNDAGKRRGWRTRIGGVCLRLATYGIVLQIGGCFVQAPDIPSFQLLTWLRTALVNVFSTALLSR